MVRQDPAADSLLASSRSIALQDANRYIDFLMSTICASRVPDGYMYPIP